MLQGSEILIILLLALIVLGPARLPEMARRMGRWSAELRHAARELREGLEAEVGDLREIRRDLEAPIDEMRREFREVSRDLDSTVSEARLKWVGPKPVSGPTPEEALADLDEIERERGRESGA
ncbi:MAG TPA: twin-arginine translocase TatA/TatE family subunit [Acidimicrobiia bacterium]|jgi:sec-independent protein translocase protein TatB|nr:twin-arginine translocase TatA/TatE family subunit [Acidimicrobiia bacterium]